MGVAGSY